MHLNTVQMIESFEQGNLPDGGIWDPLVLIIKADFFQCQNLSSFLVLTFKDLAVVSLPDLTDHFKLFQFLVHGIASDWLSLGECSNLLFVIRYYLKGFFLGSPSFSPQIKGFSAQ